MGCDADHVLRSELAKRGMTDVRVLGSHDLVELAARYALWLPVDTYRAAPWIAPYAVRKIRIRTDDRAPGPKRDLWGMPDENGYFTDDNSLIKGVVRSLPSPPESPYGGRSIDKGLVCCHVWPSTTTDPLLFSFVPNLVWLPKTLARYSDAHLPGSPHRVHEVLKSIATERYRSQTPDVGQRRCAQAWEQLPQGTTSVPRRSFEFMAGTKVADLATQRVSKMIAFLEATLDENTPAPGRFSKRYHAGVGNGIDPTVWPVQSAVPVAVRQQLLADLRSCLAISFDS